MTVSKKKNLSGDNNRKYATGFEDDPKRVILKVFWAVVGSLGEWTVVFQGDYLKEDTAHLNVLRFGCICFILKKSSHYFIVSKGRTKIKIISLVFLLLVM